MTGYSSNEYMQCITDFLESGESETVTALTCITVKNASTESLQQEAMNVQKDAMKVLFLIYCASLVFMMQAGFAMICTGSVRKKNVQNTLLKNLLDVCGSSIAFFFLGYAFAFGGDPDQTSFIGSTNFMLMGTAAEVSSNGLDYAHWFFHFSFAATSGESIVQADCFELSCSFCVRTKTNSIYLPLSYLTQLLSLQDV